MSTTTELPQALEAVTERKGRWITDWRPDDPVFWEQRGKAIARRNLALSVFCEHLGFCIWVLWTVIAVNLVNVGIKLSVPELFWLTAIPNLIGSGLRIPYTFAIARFGGRMWTFTSAMLLLIPALLAAVLVPSGWLAHQSHSTQLWVLMACAATAGVGGGNFSSSMANISFFYPEGKKGLALGINAAGGNLGVAVTQLLVPLILILGVPAAAVALPVHHVHLAYAGLVWLPFIVVAATLAWFRMDSLSTAHTDTEAYKLALGNAHTWIVSALYIGTFGSFIGYSFALPLVIKNTFPAFLAHHSDIANYLGAFAFLGALVGSLTRPLGGWLSDRLGGASVTLVSFLGMAACVVPAAIGVQDGSFGLFLASFIVIFALSGLGNGSTYRMIPAIFSSLAVRRARRSGDDSGPLLANYRRQAAAVIGIAGSIGAFGGFLIQVVFRQASLKSTALMTKATASIHNKHALALAKAHIAHANQNWSVPALWVFCAVYVLLGVLTWAAYMRGRIERV
ncbi:MAG: NarK/NasA family nitrate transporter [Solirubrobacterales bacterium]|nr:NarK/NasA family nitrate transporter [Solirubrobacterales bacterium]